MPPSPLPHPDPIAGVAAAAFPGLGHIVRGRTKRGLLAMVGVLGLFLYGLLIGGIDAVDSRDDRVWFFGAALVGPLAFGVDWAHQNHFKAYDPATDVLRTGRPGEVRTTNDQGRATWTPASSEQLEAGMGPPNTPGLGRLNEIAMLSIALAGMLNLIVFLDAFLPDLEPAAKPAGVKPGTPAMSAAASGPGGDA